MLHRIKGRKFGRYTAHRKAMLMNLAKEIVKHGSIMTTLPKAKDIRPIFEKLITLAKKATLHTRRQALSFFAGDNAVVSKLFTEIAVSCRNRNSGYLRIVKAGFRTGDCAPMAIVELIDYNNDLQSPT